MNFPSQMRAGLAALVFSAVALTLPASAQGVFDLPPLTAQTSAAAQAAPQPSAENEAALTYAVSPDLRVQNQKKFIEGLRALDPTAMQGMDDQDLIALLGTAIQPYGLKVDNIGDAFTAWLMVNHSLVHGYDEDPTPAQVDGTRKLAIQGLMGVPEIMTASDADKQSMAEGLLLQTLLNQVMVNSIKEVSPENLPTVVDQIRTGTRDMGLDLDQLEMTPNGLVAKQ